MKEASTTTERIEALGVLPVIEIDSPEQAAPLAAALYDGGIDCLEVTLRTDSALSSIRELTSYRPDMLVGAGTVLTPEQADAAIAAGASFIVTPGFNPTVVRHCVSNGYLIIPGVDSASTIELALEAGLSRVKFFPAQSLGGISTLRSMAAPFKSKMRFIPLGGLAPDNLTGYARNGLVFAIGGTWIAKADLVRAGDFEQISANARDAVRIMHGLQVQSIHFAEGGEDVSDLFRILADLGAGIWQIDQPSAENGQDVSRGEIRLCCNNPNRTALWLRMSRNVDSRQDVLEMDGRRINTFVLSPRLEGFTIRLVPHADSENLCNDM